MIGQVVATTMRPDLVTAQGLGPLPKSLLEFSSDTLPTLGGHDSEGDDFGFLKIFTLPWNGWAIRIRPNILEHEAQKTHNLRVTLRNQSMRTGVPLSREGEPILLVESSNKFQ